MLKDFAVGQSLLEYELKGRDNLVEGLLGCFRGDNQSCTLFSLCEELAREDIDYRLLFSLPSGNRNWVERRINPGVLTDARDRFVNDGPELPILPEVGVIVYAGRPSANPEHGV